MAILNGVNVNWGVDTTVSGVNGLFQTRDHNYKVQSEEIKDGGETTLSKAYWDFMEEATFTYVAFQFSGTPGYANVDIPYIGQFVNVIDGRYQPINGFWLVDDIVIAGSNTSAARVTLKLTRYPYVARI